MAYDLAARMTAPLVRMTSATHLGAEAAKAAALRAEEAANEVWSLASINPQKAAEIAEPVVLRAATAARAAEASARETLLYMKAARRAAVRVVRLRRRRSWWHRLVDSIWGEGAQ